MRLLDGGYDAWVQGGHPLETVARFPTSVPVFGADVPVHPDLIADIEEAKQILADPDGRRARQRPHLERAHREDQRLQLHPTGRENRRGRLGQLRHRRVPHAALPQPRQHDAPYPEIAANWNEAGITPDKWVAFYCGTGWRASETWFYARLMDWPNVAVYDGGWLEWSQNPGQNPIEMGQPELPA